MVSQDRHEAWLTLARVKPGYINYLLDKVIGDDAYREPSLYNSSKVASTLSIHGRKS
jgi:hypothetical protein